MIFFNLIGNILIAEDVTAMQEYLFTLKLRHYDRTTFLKSLLQPRVLISLNDVSAANYMPVHISRLGTGAISTGVKRSGREADYLSPFSAEVKNGGAIPPLISMSSWYSG
jgi:hypothetical protein